MAVTPGILASGQLAAASATLYTASGNEYVTTIIITNKDTVQRTTYMSFRDSVDAVDVSIVPYPFYMDAGDSYQAIAVKGSLNNGDVIKGYADAADAVDYIIFGGT
jgi:hypothetical protein